MGRPGQYVFRPSNSKFYHTRFQVPSIVGGKGYTKKTESLGTTDRAVANRLAIPRIAKHLDDLARIRANCDPNAETKPLMLSRQRVPPGFHELKDGLGTCVTASQTTLIFTRPGLDPWEEKNIEWFPAQGPESPRAHYESVKNGYDFMGGFKGGRIRIGWQDDPPPPPKPSRPKPCPDDEHLERWIAHRRITGYLEKEARVAWATFREITDGKPLKDCDRDDGRKLVAHFEGIGNRRATIGKKVGHLCAAVNLAIDEGKLKFNPFASVLPKEKEGDAEKREPMSDEDMATVRAGLDTLDDQERLLWMLLATTGMRRGEAFQIKREFREQGIRYVIVGSKTDASLRRVPLPDAVLPLLPAKIEGPLFADMSPKGIKNLGRELLRAIRKLGVGGNLKDLHSLRHRAKDRLRAEGCPEDLQKWCLGHDKRTVSDGYGKGPPVTLLKPWIEKIGY